MLLIGLDDAAADDLTWIISDQWLPPEKWRERRQRRSRALLQLAEALSRSLSDNQRQEETISPLGSLQVHDDGMALITRAESAALLSVSTRTVDRLAAAGTLERVRVAGSTRFRRADVEALAGGSV